MLTKQQLDFLQLVTPPALEQQRLWGIPACVTIAQAILESSWGASALATHANNYFGIKYVALGFGKDLGPYIAQTWEVVNGEKKVIEAKFQRYEDLIGAFTAHSLLLMRPWYKAAYAARSDWKEFAARLGPKTSPLDSEHCGYSTNPNYAAELIKLVTLYRLDDPRAQQWYATGKDPGAGFGTRDSGHGEAA